MVELFSSDKHRVTHLVQICRSEFFNSHSSFGALSPVLLANFNFSTMELSAKSSNIVFVNTLHDNPSAQWPAFYREAKQISWRLMQEYPCFPGGLLYLVVPIAEYNAIPQITVGGNLIPPTIPLYPADLPGNASASDIAFHRIGVDLCLHYFRISEAFKSAILIAMGDALVQPIADARAGYAVTMPVLEIFDHLRATYGVLTTGDIRALQAQLQTFIQGDDMPTFVSFAANFSETIERLETAGQGLRPFQQMEFFINSTSTQPNISRAIDKYVENNPVLGLRSLPQMIAYVRTNLSNITPTSAASGYSAMAQKQFEKACTDKILDLENKLAAAVSQISAGGKAPWTAPSSPRPNNKQSFVRPANRQYCFYHGYFDHPGKSCRVMLKNRGQFSPAMLSATSPTDVPGGSTRS